MSDRLVDVPAMKISIIAAVARNGVIGLDGGLPWRMRKDLRRFRRLTMGHHLVVGRRTWDETGRPLPGRTMVVVTRHRGWSAEGALAVHSLEDAVAIARAAGETECFIGGGSEIYRMALDLADVFYLTEIHADVEGDTRFPEWDRSAWREVAREDHEADEKNPYPYSFVDYARSPEDG